jgi:5-methylthioadenosine/S-adenosylhomocysteine deaminase
VLQALRPTIRDAVAQRLAAPALPLAQQLERVEMLAQAVDAPDLRPHVQVQYGPMAPQWCSDALLAAVAEHSARTGRRIHMHLLETAYQRQWADQAHPDGLVRHLDALGLLTPRLTVAHAVWAREEELDLLAERGVTIAVNTSSNLGLQSGLAPVAAMRRRGCRIAMGLDGMALDEDDDAQREGRLGYYLHRGWGFEPAMTLAELWSFMAVQGRLSVFDESGGTLAPGESADFMVLDTQALMRDVLFDDVDPWTVWAARANARHIRSVVVGGQLRVDQGRVLGVDEPALEAEMLARLRHRLATEPAWSAWRSTVDAMAEDLGPFYRSGRFLGCC